MAAPESVFITGASRGIGLAIARRFAAAGYTVGAVDVDDTGLAALRDEAAQGDWKVWTSVMDVTDIDAWHRALGEFVATVGGRLDILVNNAGVLAAGEFADISAARHRQQVDVNVTGVIFGCHAAFEHLRRTTGARVLNMCSASAIYGQAELASYSATKFAVRGLTEALEIEWRPHGIAVMALWPLFVDTALLTGVTTGTTQTLGVNLTADDVADAAWRALRRKSRLLKVHYPVGRQTKVVYHLAQYSPAWATRLVNKRMAH
ncbi:MAG: SDR family oxidoreductase [Mycobacteriaceae bacterium]|nr:SDR family oxidoreductase [Mycobacteriaceae bacterium]